MMEQADRSKCITLEQLALHLREIHGGLKLSIPQGLEEVPVVIRLADADFGLAAAHHTEDRVIFDLGNVLVS